MARHAACKCFNDRPLAHAITVAWPRPWRSQASAMHAVQEQDRGERQHIPDGDHAGPSPEAW